MQAYSSVLVGLVSNRNFAARGVGIGQKLVAHQSALFDSQASTGLEDELPLLSIVAVLRPQVHVGGRGRTRAGYVQALTGCVLRFEFIIAPTHSDELPLLGIQAVLVPDGYVGALRSARPRHVQSFTHIALGLKLVVTPAVVNELPLLAGRVIGGYGYCVGGRNNSGFV
jgi:hypothetical protein